MAGFSTTSASAGRAVASAPWRPPPGSGGQQAAQGTSPRQRRGPDTHPASCAAASPPGRHPPCPAPRCPAAAETEARAQPGTRGRALGAEPPGQGAGGGGRGAPTFTPLSFRSGVRDGGMGVRFPAGLKTLGAVGLLKGACFGMPLSGAAGGGRSGPSGQQLVRPVTPAVPQLGPCRPRAGQALPRTRRISARAGEATPGTLGPQAHPPEWGSACPEERGCGTRRHHSRGGPPWQRHACNLPFRASPGEGARGGLAAPALQPDPHPPRPGPALSQGSHLTQGGRSLLNGACPLPTPEVTRGPGAGKEAVSGDQHMGTEGT